MRPHTGSPHPSKCTVAFARLDSGETKGHNATLPTGGTAAKLTQLDSAQSECSPARLMARALNQTWPVWLRSSGSESAMEVLVTPSRVRVSLAQAIS
eukprot:scaffold133332_cov78-Phaeocystis_antarctica.AAC.5